MKSAATLSSIAFLASVPFAHAGQNTLAITEPQHAQLQSEQPQDSKWGVTMAVRSTTVPFVGTEKSASDVFPLFYYTGESFFLKGDHGGLRLWESDKAGLNAVARYRFLDVPDEYSEEFQGGTVDSGLQLYLKLNDKTQLQFDALSDPDGRIHSELRLAGDYRNGCWSLFPELELRFTGAKFNTRYYGLGATDLDRGLEVGASLKGRRQVRGNWHIETKGEVSFLGSEATNSPLIEDSVEWEFYVGLGLFDTTEKPVSNLKAQPYWRVSEAWGTSSDLQNMIFGEHKTVDGADVRSTSIFYGHPLSDTLFGAPIEMYLTSGMLYHHASDVQGNSLEFALGFKGFYTFDTPWRTRLGIAEGISYADTVTFYEREELAEKGSSESRLLNYIDVTFDVNVGDITQSDRLEDLWLGTGIHHRSGIYGSSSAFGNISGGTNFSSVYLQWHGGF